MFAVPIFTKISSETNRRLRKVTGRRKGQTNLRDFIEAALKEKLDREKGAAA